MYMGMEGAAQQPGAVPAEAAECLAACGMPEHEAGCLAQVRAAGLAGGASAKGESGVRPACTLPPWRFSKTSRAVQLPRRLALPHRAACKPFSAPPLADPAPPAQHLAAAVLLQQCLHCGPDAQFLQPVQRRQRCQWLPRAAPGRQHGSIRVPGGCGRVTKACRVFLPGWTLSVTSRRRVPHFMMIPRCPAAACSKHPSLPVHPPSLVA